MDHFSCYVDEEDSPPKVPVELPADDGHEVEEVRHAMVPSSTPIGEMVAAPPVSTFCMKPVKAHNPEVMSIYVNPRAEFLDRPIKGPLQPHEKQFGGFTRFHQNHLTGHVETYHVSGPAFDREYQNYRNEGKAHDPSDWHAVTKRPVTDHLGLTDAGASLAVHIPAEVKEAPEVDAGGSRRSKRRREARGQPGEDSFLGPWAKYIEERSTVMSNIGRESPVAQDAEMHSESEDKAATDAETAPEPAKMEQVEVVTSIFHGKHEKDYQGFSWIEPPRGMVPREEPPECQLPRKLLHTYVGHTMGVHTIRFFPGTGHLLLSGSMDTKIKMWDCLNQRKCLRTYTGHSQAVRDIQFQNDGKKFYSCSYDRNILLWDAEYGKIIGTFTNSKIPYCVTIHPETGKQNDFIVGCSNKKAVEFDANSGKIVQEYNEHLAAVNTVTFCDDNRKIVTTSDDKKLFVWEHGIPVVVKHISEPHMHSMPSVKLHPNNKYLAAQSMDNKIVVYEASGRFRFQGRKCFRGHINSGYAIQPDFSPDGKFLMSGDISGKVWFWDWRNMKNYRTIKCHDGVAICTAWHPSYPTRIATCGWDGLVKLWD